MQTPLEHNIPEPDANMKATEALSHPVYRILWIAAWFWYTCRMMELVTLSWLVLELTNSPSQVAFVGASRMLPMFLLGLIAGSLADRLPKRRVMIGIQLANVTMCVGILILILSKTIQPWHVFVAVFLTGCTYTMDFSTRRSYLSEIIGPRGLVTAISLDTVALTGSAMLGPLLAGPLISMISFGGVYGIIVIMYGIGLGLLLYNSVDVKTHPLALSNSIGAQVIDAVKAIRSNRVIFATLMVTITLNFFGFPYLQMVPVIARDILGVGSVLYGILVSIAGLGALMGSILIASRKIHRRGTVYSLGAMFMLTAVFLFAMSPVYGISLLVLFFAGLGMSGFATMQSSIILQAASLDMRGRALGAVAIGIGASPLGMLLVGQLAEWIGPQTAVGVLAGTGFIVMVGLRWKFIELRN